MYKKLMLRLQSCKDMKIETSSSNKTDCLRLPRKIFAMGWIDHTKAYDMIP